MTTVHVALLSEGTEVWRPVVARDLGGSTYEIVGPVPEGEEWQFQPGQVVICELRTFADGQADLVATAPAPPNNSFKGMPLRGTP